MLRNGRLRCLRTRLHLREVEVEVDRSRGQFIDHGRHSIDCVAATTQIEIQWTLVQIRSAFLNTCLVGLLFLRSRHRLLIAEAKIEIKACQVCYGGRRFHNHRLARGSRRGFLRKFRQFSRHRDRTAGGKRGDNHRGVGIECGTGNTRDTGRTDCYSGARRMTLATKQGIVRIKPKPHGGSLLPVCANAAGF